ncbi:hypothetical protein DS832_00050 [Bombilactobacillus bombi]|uniref:Uncharacterized protein n=1 Tax=Bombilactobacillus bombi TaxID=1303590 RepID=A0A3R6YKM9_9LACO|nr:hypothetical protein [Bombilactobacillus bombi]RHW48819.1 hypothetical protein DS832_00050 [Bombilactobacillus bombi]
MKKILDQQKQYIQGPVMIIALKNNQRINIQDYPQLEELGKWVVPNDQTNLRLITNWAQPKVIERFSQITGLKTADFDARVVSGIWSEDK